ncbi:MAG: aminopeptidase P family N-terminal domain-containing protein [Candidatus Scalindua sediminis]|nr:aminopeptidase P family N-terminal domain-containing protein [Candidatus Scalindua sediminis]
MRDNKAILIIADSERDSNIYYATGFLAPDPFVYIKKDNEKIMVTSGLELDRARSQSKVDKVFPLSKYEKIVKKRGNKASKFIELVITVLREINIKKLLVPANHQKQMTNTMRN